MLKFIYDLFFEPVTVNMFYIWAALFHAGMTLSVLIALTKKIKEHERMLGITMLRVFKQEAESIFDIEKKHVSKTRKPRKQKLS